MGNPIHGPDFGPGLERKLSRRSFLKLGGGLAIAAAGVALAPKWSGKILRPDLAAAAGPTSPAPTVLKHLAATDGWVSLPGTVYITGNSGPTYTPDPFAPSPLTTYAFGFRDVTGLPANLVSAQKNKTQSSAPLLVFDEGDAIQITLTNLGLAQRPDLVDSHTIHWHGFRDATPIFDGVPEMSISVPIGADFPYYYHPQDPGTYMYHCHFEDVEHVQMGMTGIVFVRPSQNKTGNAAGAPVSRYNGGPSAAPLGYAYNDGVATSDPNSTAYDREFGLFLSEVWALARYYDAHIQQMDWSEFHADIFTINGRAYPDTLAPNGGGTDLNTGNLIAPPGRPDLQYQPISSLVQCNAGDKVLLRFVNLGYTQAAMRLAGIKMHVVGKDATLLRGLVAGGARTGANTSYYTDTIYIGAGESYDAIFTAPPKSGSGYDTYLLFNNAVGALTTPGAPGLGGQMTEVRVYAAGTLPKQTVPNT